MSTIRKAAIFGAAGAIGQTIAPELERRGIPFRVVGRSQSRLQAAFGQYKHAEIFNADLSELRSAGAAARGVDTIIYSVGLPYPSHHLHPVLMATTLAAAATMHVERLVLISSVYPYGVPRTSRVPETQPREPVARKGEYRKAQEDLVLAAHAKGDLRGLIVTLPDFYGPHADISLADMIFQAALDGKTANWLGPVNTPHEFVYLPDAAPVIVELAECSDCYGERWNLGGFGAINSLDFISRVYKAAGHAPKYRSVGKGMLKMMGWFSPFYRELPEMIYLQETPVILDDSKLAAKFGALHKTSYDQGIQQTIDWMRERRAKGGAAVSR